MDEDTFRECDLAEARARQAIWQITAFVLVVAGICVSAVAVVSAVVLCLHLTQWGW